MCFTAACSTRQLFPSVLAAALPFTSAVLSESCKMGSGGVQDAQAEAQYRVDVLGDFTGRASYRQTAPTLAWAAELERSSRQGWTRQRQLRAKLAHDTDRLQLECEAWQR